MVLVVNTEAARILKAIDTFNVYLPKQEIKNKLNIRHANDSVVEVEIESLDAYGAIKEACDVISVVLSLHKISQHHTNCFIRKNVLCFMIEDEDITETIKWTTDHNILLRAKNESKLQSAFFNEQLVKNIGATDTFYKAVRLHNSALDSKDSSNQLLDLWTAVETMVDFKTGSRDKISVICDVLINVLVRSYLYNRVEQLLNDIHNIIGDKVDELLQTGERATTAFAKILSVPENHDIYNEVYSLLDEAPLLQYRMELFNKEIFVNSRSIYEELRRHEKRLKWQIMRIYRNRNMIVHNGDYMPYIDVILGNLHYYLDMMYDVLIEYYHLGWTDNQDIFYRLEKERLDHYIKLGVTESGVIKNPVAIMEENYKELLFNGFEGNVIKNIVKDISNGHNK